MGPGVARTGRVLVVACTAGLLSAGAAAAAEQGPSPCPPAGETVLVLTEARALWLCTGGEPERRFTVALGRGGIGKRRRGDGRTPLGRYALGAPRPSARYGTFIPISYPTVAQASRGFTGSAVGIHGPPRGMEDGAYPVTELDWTLGCIATGTDAEVATIAEFVRAHRARIVIR